MSGVRTIEDIKDRCTVDDITDCWHWQMARTGGPTPQPSLWLPVLRKRVTMGVAIAVLTTGKTPGEGVRWHCTCETKGCANPAHRLAGTKSSQMLAAKMVRSAAVCARIARGKRAGSKISEAAVIDIRTSAEPLTIVAARHSCSVSHAAKIRIGQMRRELGARGASVFNLGAWL